MLENILLVFAVLFDFFVGYIAMKLVCRSFGSAGKRAERSIRKTGRISALNSKPPKDHKRRHLQRLTAFFGQKAKKAVSFGENGGKTIRSVIQ